MNAENGGEEAHVSYPKKRKSGIGPGTFGLEETNEILANSVWRSV